MPSIVRIRRFRKTWQLLPAISAILLFLVVEAYGQTPSVPASSQSLSKGYNSILLGMDYQAAYEAIRSDTSLDYDGVPDISLSPGRDEKIIETRGGRYIRRGVFQFRNDKLFSITIEFEGSRIDFYSLFDSFQSRFGEPKDLSPERIIWENDSTRLVLEYPLTLKYLDVAVFAGLLEQSLIEASIEAQVLSEFINGL